MLRHFVLGAALVAFAAPAVAQSDAPAETKTTETAAVATPQEEKATVEEAAAPATNTAGSKSTPRVKFGGSGCSWSTAEAPMS